MSNAEHPAPKKDTRWMSTGYVSVTNLEGIPAGDEEDLARLDLDVEKVPPVIVSIHQVGIKLLPPSK